MLSISSMINLQKSDWGGQFYLNLAVCITKLDNSSDSPLEHKCPIRRRLDRIVSDRELLLQALDLENGSIQNEDRANIITNAIVKDAVPWLLALSTLDGIRNRIMTDDTTRSWITPVVIEFLEAKP